MAGYGSTAVVMLANFAAPEPRRAYCNDCDGKGFALTRGRQQRVSQKCLRCRGAGSIAVGNTKR